MRVLQIATLGEEEDTIFVGLRDYPVSKLILIHEPDQARKAAEIIQKASGLKIEGERRVVQNPAMDMYSVLADILAKERGKYDDVYLNVSSGRKLLTCAAISAAFVNGIKAFHVEGNEPMLLPILKFSYTEILSKTKISILTALEGLGGSVESLNQLSERAGVEKALLSYHIRGGREGKGLQEMGLVDVGHGPRGRLRISLTQMGRILLLGVPESTS